MVRIQFSQKQPSAATSLCQRLFLTTPNSFPPPCLIPFIFPSRPCPILAYFFQTSAPLELPPPASSVDPKCGLLAQEGFSPSQVGVLHDNVSFRAASLERVASVISFLRSKGLFGAQAGKILARTPRMLEYKAEGLERKCKFLEDLGMGALGFKRLLTNMHTRPALCLRIETLQEHIDFLLRIGLNIEDVLKVVSAYPNILLLSVERKMEPAVVFFERHGMSKEGFCRLVRLHPRVFGYSIDGSIRKRLDFLHSLGLRLDSTSGARAFRSWVLAEPKVLLSKWECLRRNGFSDSEILKMVKQHPDILISSEHSMNRKTDYFKNVLNRDVQQLAKFPVYLGLSLENRVIPRFTFLNLLKEKGARAKTLSLSSVLTPSDEVFEKRYGNGYRRWKAGFLDQSREI